MECFVFQCQDTTKRYQKGILKRYQMKKLTKLFFNTFEFINQKILQGTQESTTTRAAVLTIGYANIAYELKSMLGWKLKLQYPNSTLQFPLPNRWSNPNKSYSKQQFYMVVKQIHLTLKQAGTQRRNEINASEDKSRTAIRTMELLSTLHIGEIDNIMLVDEKYNVLTDAVYNKERELLFADSLVSGEVSYMLRKYATPYYQIQESQKIDQDYRTAFQTALKEQTWNDNAQLFGLSREEIIRRVQQNDGVYSMLFQHLEKESKGDVIVNFPENYVDNTKLDELHYMHVPYPIFLRVQKSESNDPSFICIGIGTRIKQQTRIFSPFFANQGERVWRLMQSHVASMALNDFSVRIHLGCYHFTSSQYNVPVYNCLDRLKNENHKKSYRNFLDHSYSMFNRGLEGVNVAATASLVHPIQRFSLVNRVLSINQQHAINIIAGTSNNLKIAEFDPRNILRKQGLSEDQVKKNFKKMSFDFKLYDILSEYIEGVYNAFHCQEIAEVHLFNEINEQTQHMGVGEGSTPRPKLSNRQEVLKTLKNLCFIWAGFHQHTFSVISVGMYMLLRPSVLVSQIPDSQTEWENIQIGHELPDAKMMMESGKLNESTTIRDADNYLMDNIRRQYEMAGYLSNKHKSDSELSESYGKLEKVALKTYEKLKAYEEEVLAVNRERRAKKNSLAFQWMLPSSMQTSLNI